MPNVLKMQRAGVTVADDLVNAHESGLSTT
jgi:hypothetical protein